MTYGDLIIDCLHMMMADGETYLKENIALLQADSVTAPYIKNCYGAINRALARIIALHKIPYKKVTKKVNSSKYIDMNVENPSSIVRLIKDGYIIESYRYELWDNQLRGEYNNFNEGEECEIIYEPKIPPCNVDSLDLEIPLPDELIYIIPMYAYGEIMYNEEPSLSIAKKNEFELALRDSRINSDFVQKKILRVW